ncbi:MAG: AzlD domain-containing protein [Chloroflexi bacterium]|nr:MAG: AzlD domain-containing protein [Chloroflexota bacterium]
MSTDLVPLAFVMWAVTYPSRAVGLLAPALERLPRRALEYLRLVGPAILAALAAVNTVIATGEDGRASIALGVSWIAVVVSIGLVYWRRSLLLGLVAAVAIAAAGRAVGLD